MLFLPWPCEIAQRFSSLLHCLLLWGIWRTPLLHFLQIPSSSVIKSRLESSVVYELLSKWMDRWSFILNLKKKRSPGEMVDEEISVWITNRYLAGCYIRYHVVISTICSNGGRVLILYFLKIEMFPIFVQFIGQMWTNEVCSHSRIYKGDILLQNMFL